MPSQNYDLKERDDMIQTLNAATGRELWLRRTIPAPGESGNKTWNIRHARL